VEGIPPQRIPVPTRFLFSTTNETKHCLVYSEKEYTKPYTRSNYQDTLCGVTLSTTESRSNLLKSFVTPAVIRRVKGQREEDEYGS
jgi:hypothetical protein